MNFKFVERFVVNVKSGGKISVISVNVILSVVNNILLVWFVDLY